MYSPSLVALIKRPLTRLFRKTSWTKLFLTYLIPVLLLFALINHLVIQSYENVKTSQYLGMAAKDLENAVQKNIDAQKVLRSFMNVSSSHDPTLQITPVLVIACNRLGIRTTLDTLLRLKSELKTLPRYRFPIYVSHACDSEKLAKLLRTYGDLITVITPSYPLLDPSLKKKLLPTDYGYRHVASHYKWALDHMFLQLSFSSLIIIEDDLDLAPDIFEYFASTLPLLIKDPTLFCVSAWNDNGRPELVDQSRPDLLYRTDFFPGLGWMLLRSLWLDVRVDWPQIYWDEHMRQSHVRRNRSCIRPELSRSITFGEHGVSHGQYFKTHLRYIRLTPTPFNFLEADLSYLDKSVYDSYWRKLVYEQSVEISKADFMLSKLPPNSGPSTQMRVTYVTRQDFVDIALRLQIMNDFKAGVSRNAYQGVVPVMWNNRRLFIAPPPTWTTYNLTWV